MLMHREELTISRCKGTRAAETEPGLTRLRYAEVGMKIVSFQSSQESEGLYVRTTRGYKAGHPESIG